MTKKTAKKTKTKTTSNLQPVPQQKATALPKRLVGFLHGEGAAPEQIFIPVDEILVGNNVRIDSNWKARIKELAESIRAKGQIEPILVHKLEKPQDGKKYRLYCGARRLEAVKLNKQSHILASVTTREYDEDELLLVMLTENYGREDLGAIDEAHAFKKLADKGVSVKDIASSLGRSPALVSQRLSLLDMPTKVQTAVKKGNITPTHAREIGRIKDTEKQVKMLEKTLDKHLEVQQLKEEVDAVVAKDPERKGKKLRGRPAKPKTEKKGDASVGVRSADDISKMLLRYDEQLTKAKEEHKKARPILAEATKSVKNLAPAIKCAEQIAYLTGLLKGISWSLDKKTDLRN